MPEELDKLASRLPSLCRKARITRLGDLTGLDRIGLPVVQAVRPGALSEVTTLGRGSSLVEAAIGAVMEALERFFSEIIPSDRIFLASAEELAIPHGLFENLVRADCRDKWRQIRIPWIRALDVGSGSIQPVPFELVHTRYTEPPPLGDGFFVRTTTGLACHTSTPKAFRHGLLECVERDAIARAFVTHGFFERMRCGGSAFLGSRTSRLLERVQSEGLSIALWRAPSPAGIPVVWCQTIETGPGEPMLSLPTEGYAAGGSLDAAASGALLEALVTRAGAISGARDDQTWRHYRASTDAYVAQARKLITTETPSTGDGAIEPSGAEDLGTLVQVLVAAGLGPILAVPVGSDQEASVHCVRTILPGAQPFATVR